MYSDFARVYDRLMAEVDYQGWADYYRSLLDLAGVAAGSLVCECACGTGGLSLHLARHYQLTGLDSSQEMLSIAAEKLRGAGLQLPLIRQDMRRMRLHKPQDAILCTCDGLNYLTGPRSAPRFFQAANGALKMGGALALDFSTSHKLRHVLGNNTLHKPEGDIRYIWQNSWQEGKRQLSMQLSIFDRQPGGLWRLTEESQLQRAYEPAELVDMLTQAGFGDIRFFGDRHLEAPAATEARIHLLCTKQRNLG